MFLNLVDYKVYKKKPVLRDIWVLHSNNLSNVRIKLKIFFFKDKVYIHFPKCFKQVIEYMANCKQVFREGKFVFDRSRLSVPYSSSS